MGVLPETTSRPHKPLSIAGISSGSKQSPCKQGGVRLRCGDVFVNAKQPLSEPPGLEANCC